MSTITIREEVYCAKCNGSGEGMHDGTRCSSCKGSGTEIIELIVDCERAYNMNTKDWHCIHEDITCQHNDGSNICPLKGSSTTPLEEEDNEPARA